MSHFEAGSDPIDVTSIWPYPDMAWRFSDIKGHEHQWAGPDKYHATLPTLRWVWDDPPGDDWPGRGHYVCRKCKETIEPGMLAPTSYREFIPGPRWFRIDGVEVTEEDFKRRYEAERGIKL